MDQLVLPGFAGLAVFAAVIFYLLRANAAYRADYRADHAAWQIRYNADIEANRLRLEAEIAAHQRTQEILDEERERRRQAENVAWTVTRELRSEMVQLRQSVTGDVADDAR